MYCVIFFRRIALAAMATRLVKGEGLAAGCGIWLSEQKLITNTLA
jgi:hypothetical protein